MAWKTTVMTTSPTRTGSTPLSPPLMRPQEARTYWPRDWATIAGGTWSSPASVDAVGSSSSADSSARAMLSRTSAAGRRGRCRSTRGSGCHVVDDALAVEFGGGSLRHHPAQVEHRDAVSNLEHV